MAQASIVHAQRILDSGNLGGVQPLRVNEQGELLTAGGGGGGGGDVQPVSDPQPIFDLDGQVVLAALTAYGWDDGPASSEPVAVFVGSTGLGAAAPPLPENEVGNPLRVLSSNVGGDGDVAFHAQRAQSLANSDEAGELLAATRSALLVERPAQWSAVETATGLDVDATRAAAGPGTRHIVQWLSVTICGGATATGVLDIEITSPTGLGVLFAGRIQAAVAGYASLALSGLNIPCPEDSEVSLSVAGVTAGDTVASVSLGGITV